MPPVAESTSSMGVKADFPIFARTFEGRPLVYLDSASTSQKPAVVIDAVADHLRNHNANVHRGVYALAQEADAAYDGARRRVAAFVGAQPQTTIFTKNVTEAINLVAYSWGRANVGPGDAVLITQTEHHANIVPWQVLCRERGAELRYLESRRARRALARGPRRGARARGRPARRLHPRLERARHDQPGRRDGRARSRRRRGLADRRRPGRPPHAGRRRTGSAPTSTPGPGTRRSGRRASACCTAAGRCSSRWSRS